MYLYDCFISFNIIISVFAHAVAHDRVSFLFQAKYPTECMYVYSAFHLLSSVAGHLDYIRALATTTNATVKVDVLFQILLSILWSVYLEIKVLYYIAGASPDIQVLNSIGQRPKADDLWPSNSLLLFWEPKLITLGNFIGKEEERKKVRHAHVCTHTVWLGLNTCLINFTSAHAYLHIYTYNYICMHVYTYRQTRRHLVDGTQPQKPHFISFSLFIPP